MLWSDVQDILLKHRERWKVCMACYYFLRKGNYTSYITNGKKSHKQKDWECLVSEFLLIIRTGAMDDEGENRLAMIRNNLACHSIPCSKYLTWNQC